MQTWYGVASSKKIKKSAVSAKAESVVLLPGRAGRRVVVTIALAQSTILDDWKIELQTFTRVVSPRTCFPMLVSPRASRRLCTGLAIQLILGSRRICYKLSLGSQRIPVTAYGFMTRIHQDDLVVFVDAVLIDPIRV